MSRTEAAQLGREAVLIAAEGHYRRGDGTFVEIGDAVRRCVEGTRVIRPGDWRGIVGRGRGVAGRAAAARVEVTPETTLAAARRLVEREGAVRPLVLNFASAKNPGGGFLGGSRAQEESIARVKSVMAGRIEKVLALAAAEGFEALVLGAWGCGAFRNDPRLIARLFHDALFGADRWAEKFGRVSFAVFTIAGERENIAAFEDLFAPDRARR